MVKPSEVTFRVGGFGVVLASNRLMTNPVMVNPWCKEPFGHVPLASACTIPKGRD